MAIYVSGVFCKEVLRERSPSGAELLSAIRILDIVDVEIPTDTALTEGTVLGPAEFFLLAQLRSDDPEEFEIELAAITPSGKQTRIQAFPSKLGGNVSGHAIIVTIKLNAATEGNFWFEWRIKGELMLRMPLSIRHNKVPVQTETVSMEPSE